MLSKRGSWTLAALLWTTCRTTAELILDRPWLNMSLSVEQRLELFLGQLNTTQKFAMVQGDTELDDNGTGVNPCIGHISGNVTLGVPSICMGDGPAGTS